MIAVGGRETRYLVQVCMGPGWGGPHMYLLRIAEEAARRGYEPVVACSPRHELAARARKAGFEVLAVRSDDRATFWRRLSEKTRRGVVQSIHLQSIRGLPRGFISLDPSVQMVLTEHSYRFREVPHPRSRMALSRVDLALATSKAIADVNGRALGLNPERIRILHHGVDLRRFHPDDRRGGRRKARERFGLHERDMVLVVPTTFHRVKNLFRMVEVVARLRERVPELQLLLTGNFSSGPDAQEYRREIEEKSIDLGLRGRVHLTGYLERIEDAYAAADVVCVPTEFEAFGLPAVEAMASGLPVIGSSKGAFPEIVEQGVSGVCLEVGDVDAWCEALGGLLLDRHRREQMGDKGRQRAEQHFSITHHWARLFDIYEEGRQRRRSGRAG